jgi:hypothetical protein
MLLANQILVTWEILSRNNADNAQRILRMKLKVTRIVGAEKPRVAGDYLQMYNHCHFFHGVKKSAYEILGPDVTIPRVGSWPVSVASMTPHMHVWHFMRWIMVEELK